MGSTNLYILMKLKYMSILYELKYVPINQFVNTFSHIYAYMGSLSMYKKPFLSANFSCGTVPVDAESVQDIK